MIEVSTQDDNELNSKYLKKAKLTRNHGLGTSLTTNRTKLLEIHCLVYCSMWVVSVWKKYN